MGVVRFRGGVEPETVEHGGSDLLRATWQRQLATGGWGWDGVTAVAAPARGGVVVVVEQCPTQHRPGQPA